MLLQLETWPAVEAYLARSQTIILPIGSTEQHGPNGLIGTDAICAETLAKAVGAARGILVAPTIAVGMAQHHLAFPGSISLRPSTLIAVLRDYIASLAKTGFRRFYFINGHGGNIASVTAAFSEVYAELSFGEAGNRPGVNCRLANWWQMGPVSALARELYGEAEGMHATPSEVALAWFAHPETARPEPLEPLVAPRGSFADAADYRRHFPDGRIGSNPALATVAAGERFRDVAVAAILADLAAWDL